MLWLLFIVTFLESIAGTLLQRGLYFYTHEILGFGEVSNLWLALGFGMAYVFGALGSHRAALRFGERRLLLASLFSLLALHALLASVAAPFVLFLSFFGTAFAQGMKWPLIESYVSAGHSPQQLLPVLGRYNVTWATGVFAAVGATGFLVGSGHPALFFWIPALLNLLAIALSLGLPASPLHLDLAHPARPNAAELQGIRSLLGSARWSMTGSYALLYVLAPLLPSLLAELDLSVRMATPVASVLDAVRVISFAVLGAWTGWQGRSLPLWLAMFTLPASFLLILLGGSLATLVVGEALFGFTAGFAYTAALYYALVAENASVDAGGAHEGLIGLGLGLGPLSGLAGQLLLGQRLPGANQSSSLGHAAALALAVSPIVAVCALGSLRALLKLRGRPG